MDSVGIWRAVPVQLPLNLLRSPAVPWPRKSVSFGWPSVAEWQSVAYFAIVLIDF